MPLTVSVALPVLLIVSVCCAAAPTVTLPNARLPLSPMTRVGGTLTPVPEAAIVLVPPVASELTVRLPP